MILRDLQKFDHQNESTQHPHDISAGVNKAGSEFEVSVSAFGGERKNSKQSRIAHLKMYSKKVFAKKAPSKD